MLSYTCKTAVKAVIYLASQNCNEFLRQVEICQVADISTVSLRKRCKEIKSKTEL